MQGLGVVTTENLLQRGQQPLLKLEIFVDPNWINVSDWFSYILSACDATTDWTGTALSIDNADYKEGSGSLKDTDAAPAPAGWYVTTYNPAGTWDLTNNTHVLFWLKCDRPNTAFTVARFRIQEGANWREWNLTFAAGEWTAVKELLSTGDAESGAPPDLALITSIAIQFQAADGIPFYKKIDHVRIDDSPVGEASGDFLESLSISFAGAGMSPNPIAATLTAEINNEDAIFHPRHPDSAYSDYFEAGRKVRISVGAKYGGTDYYWPRIIGHIDVPKFSGKTFKVSISGLDYTRVLADTKFKKTALPPDNYWGDVVTLDSVATTQYGPQLYVPPGGDAAQKGAGERDNVDNWAVLGNGGTAITSENDIGGFSDFEIKFVSDPAAVPGGGVVWYAGVCAVVAGTEYNVTFKYARTVGDAWLRFNLLDGAVPVGGTGNLKPAANDVFYTGSFSFTAPANANLDLKLICAIKTGDSATTWRVDQISIKSVTENVIKRYQLPDDCNGVHYVELDEGAGFLPVWPGRQQDGEEGWFYDSDLQQLYFAEGKIVDAGANNLKVYYFTQQVPEDVVADILVDVGLYGNQGDALTAMGNPVTGVTIDQVWFEAGSVFLNAIKKICERCDYRFYFKYDGTPVFAVFASPKLQDFEDLVFDRQHIAEPEYYEDRNEIRNRVVIEGLKQSLPEGGEETVPSELKGTAVNEDSIDAYGEHTLSIKNHLFQEQNSINNMCATLLARYKEPMWYFDFKTPFNPAPLEIWDTIAAILLLKSVVIHGSKYETFKYDSGTKYGCGEIAVGVRGLIRDIKIDQYNNTYKCEEA